MPTDPNPSTYYRHRADEARRLAFAATAQGVRKLHLEMASAYERQAEAADPTGSTCATDGATYSPAARTSVNSPQ